MNYISVIIPCHNRSKLIVRAMQSVINQTYKNVEIIIIDDGSTDDTELVLLPFIQTGLIKYFYQANSGVSSARNFGVSKASGNWIAFLDSDDEWLPNKLQQQIDYLRSNISIKIVYGQEIWIRNGVRVNQRTIHQKFGGWIFDKCVQQCFIAPSSVVIEKEIFEALGGFDQDFSVCEDYDLWLKISSLYEIAYISDPLIIKYGGHADQLSTKYIAMDIWRIRSLNRILNIRNLSIDQRQNVIKTIKAKGTILLKGYQKYGNTKDSNEVENILNAL